MVNEKYPDDKQQILQQTSTDICRANASFQETKVLNRRKRTEMSGRNCTLNSFTEPMSFSHTHNHVTCNCLVEIETLNYFYLQPVKAHFEKNRL